MSDVILALPIFYIQSVAIHPINFLTTYPTGSSEAGTYPYKRQGMASTPVINLKTTNTLWTLRGH